MNITNTKSINIGTEETSSKTNGSKDKNANFSEELKNVKKTDKSQKQEEKPAAKELDQKNETKQPEKNEKVDKVEKVEKVEKVDDALNGLNDTIDELKKLSQKDENDYKKNKYEVFDLIENNMNIQEPQDKFNMQMGANMSFNSESQPFTAFVKQETSKDPLKSTAKDIAEEKAILSTMEENIAIANKNMAMSKTKTVENEQGIKKVDTKTNLVVDTIVTYDNVIMTKEDVEFFANLVDNGFLEMSDVKNPNHSAHVSKTLADLLAKSMNENKPIRIDFDNNISVIIKIDKAGKISADFLPSSQVAEAYLKENLPLLRQRFDDNNIEYNELNQRQRKQDNQDNRKKERRNE